MIIFESCDNLRLNLTHTFIIRVSSLHVKLQSVLRIIIHQYPISVETFLRLRNSVEIKTVFLFNKSGNLFYIHGNYTQII
jgi:hypothetical protein